MPKRRAKPADPASAAGLVLDAGALRALERHDISILVALKTARELHLPIRIPAAALAQVWRGGPRSAPLARLLKQPTTIATIDERAARHIGELIATMRLPSEHRADVVDAHVALTTRATKSLLFTSDPHDMARYGVDPRCIRKI